jgi:hypothetical protein
MSKNYVLTYIFANVLQKSSFGATPLLLGYSDHPKVGDVLNSCCLQYSSAPVRIPISFRSQPIQNAGDDGSSVGSAPWHFLSGQTATHSSGQIPENVALYSTPSKYQGGQLGLVKVRSKLSGPKYLTVLPDLDLIGLQF